MSAVGALLSLVLTLFIVVLVIRAVLDWTGVLAGGGSGVARARGVVHAITEPVIRPVRRVVRPVRMGAMSFDLAFTLVFVAAVVLRGLVGWL
ncbi:YggT family protein [Kibdelosporangium phytohabitans]|uniref:YggT family protein n=1 Tax=Kibdelosporangium phytohabitans TaxID=860235 RepID=A0A0N9HUC3_9PSEU|nr:YggT family protein [Kibdelosporangium phytohabitans]ALG07100.1 hypothetical protein AOZ06_09330 [Kibdelosporangium phytohabitans]MBE1468412.1 YggT family protein [Kibdelosporangium phytohabitans]